MPATRRGLLACGSAALLAGPARTRAAAWPDRPVRLVAPFAAGGPVDGLGRLLADQLRARIGRPFLVENVVGAGTMIATDQVARAAPDGHTFLLAVSSHSINPAVRTVRYDPIADFTPVILIATPLHLLLVHRDVPAASIQELIALARRKPGTLAYGSVGLGTSTHMEAELFARMAGIELLHVPYRGSAPALLDLVSGRIPMMFDGLASARPHLDTGAVRALGVTSIRRSALLPDLPTIAESGLPGYEVMPWVALLGPAGVPKPIVDRLDAECRAILAQDAIRRRFAEFGVEILAYPPERLAAFLVADLHRWQRVAQDAGLRLAR